MRGALHPCQRTPGFSLTSERGWVDVGLFPPLRKCQIWLVELTTFRASATTPPSSSPAKRTSLDETFNKGKSAFTSTGGPLRPNQEQHEFRICSGCQIALKSPAVQCDSRVVSAKSVSVVYGASYSAIPRRNWNRPARLPVGAVMKFEEGRKQRVVTSEQH